jgi:dTDP-4-dehydrorhamnose 3,5-epimerase-like enzyme
MNEIYVKNSGYIYLPKIVDDKDGSLVVAEAGLNIPFPIKRVYYIGNFEKCRSIRGKHAHKQLEQVIFCISGSFTLQLDDGEKKQQIVMDKDNVGVVLGKELWHEMKDFSPDAVLLVLASDHYNEGDYIRDYDRFLAYVKK